MILKKVGKWHICYSIIKNYFVKNTTAIKYSAAKIAIHFTALISSKCRYFGTGIKIYGDFVLHSACEKDNTTVSDEQTLGIGLHITAN